MRVLLFFPVLSLSPLDVVSHRPPVGLGSTVRNLPYALSLFRPPSVKEPTAPYLPVAQPLDAMHSGEQDSQHQQHEQDVTGRFDRP